MAKLKDVQVLSISTAQFIQGQFEYSIRDYGIRTTITLLQDALESQYPGEEWRIEVKLHGNIIAKTRH